MKIIVLSGAELDMLARWASRAAESGGELRVMTYDTSITVKVNGGMWSAPMGELAPESEG